MRSEMGPKALPLCHSLVVLCLSHLLLASLPVCPLVYLALSFSLCLPICSRRHRFNVFRLAVAIDELAEINGEHFSRPSFLDHLESVVSIAVIEKYQNIRIQSKTIARLTLLHLCFRPLDKFGNSSGYLDQ